MKKIVLFFFGLVMCFFDLHSQNTEILNLTNKINQDSLQQNVIDLQSFSTRYAYSPNRKEVAEYLKTRLEDYGFEVVLDSFLLQTGWFPTAADTLWQYNVIGEKQGIWAKDTTIHLMAHYDSRSDMEGFEDYFNFAPGADDNASGVAALLEIARVFHQNNIQPIKTLVINFFAAEEQGLRGSWDRIEKISTPIWQEDIKAVINLDMIGYCTSDSTDYVFDIITYDGSEALTQMAIDFSEDYSILQYNTTTENNYASDSYSFYAYGVSSVFLMEHEFTPHYHTERDVHTTINYHFMREITKVAFALAYECSVNNEYGTVTSIDEVIKPISEVKIVSNPVSKELKFSCRNLEVKSRYTIYNQSSQIISEGRVENPNGMNKIDISNINNGVYFLKIISENQIITKKLIVLN
ncbi:MAG: M20/M25/M40 family metallo-hydrolase [Bacteroidales bacterium]|nr:M20/M25/M40 family metallo-hydrolase [Bacteroidales bacterium]